MRTYNRFTLMRTNTWAVRRAKVFAQKAKAQTWTRPNGPMPIGLRYLRQKAGLGNHLWRR